MGFVVSWALLGRAGHLLKPLGGTRTLPNSLMSSAHGSAALMATVVNDTVCCPLHPDF